MHEIVSRPLDRPLAGAVKVPGDKSVSHRAALMGLLAKSPIRVRGFLAAGDTLATLAAVSALGARVEGSPADTLEITPAPLHPAEGALDLGNSGTGMRLLAGILAGQPFVTEITGDESLRGRPMGRVIRPLTAMGAQILSAPGDRPPLRFQGNAPLSGITWRSSVSSAQVKSCVLLAGLLARGETRFSEPAPSRDHTERMLAHLGAPVRRGADGALILEGGQSIGGGDIEVSGDPSSAAFHVVAATVIPGSDVLLRDVGVNPLRVGFIRVLRRMGADIELSAQREAGREPVADIRVRSASLAGIEVAPSEVPDMIDEFPAFFVAAACAQGTTRVSGAGELRVKESDRLGVMAKALGALGIKVIERDDGLELRGGRLRGGRVDGAGDHRCAMALLIGGAVANSPVTVTGCGGIPTSYPRFLQDSAELGMDLAEVEG